MRAHHRAGLAFGEKSFMHRRRNQVDADRHQRILVVVERVAEGREEQHRARRSGLVLVEHDLRNPLDVHLPVDGFRLRLVGDVGVAIVVVPDILLVEPRDVHVARSLGSLSRMYQLATNSMPSGLMQVQQQDIVVENAHRLGIVAAEQIVGFGETAPAR